MIKQEFMKRALELAIKAMNEGEIPVGAVIVKDDKIIGEGYNCCESLKNATRHAEILAIETASETLGNWRLNECCMYVSMEPCPMCMGAILNSRVSRVVFGAYNENSGACVSCMKLEDFSISPNPIIIGGYMQGESREIVREFFEKRR